MYPAILRRSQDYTANKVSSFEITLQGCRAQDFGTMALANSEPAYVENGNGQQHREGLPAVGQSPQNALLPTGWTVCRAHENFGIWKLDDAVLDCPVATVPLQDKTRLHGTTLSLQNSTVLSVSWMCRSKLRHNTRHVPRRAYSLPQSATGSTSAPTVLFIADITMTDGDMPFFSFG